MVNLFHGEALSHCVLPAGDPCGELVGRLRAEPPVHEDAVAEEQGRRNLVERFGEEHPLRRQRNLGQLDRAVCEQPFDVCAAAAELDRGEDADVRATGRKRAARDLQLRERVRAVRAPRRPNHDERGFVRG